MHAIDKFAMYMRGVHGVQSVLGVPDMAKVGIAANNEGNPRWAALPRSSQALQQGSGAYNPDLGMNTDGCSAIQVLIYTKDHQGHHPRAHHRARSSATSPPRRLPPVRTSRSRRRSNLRAAMPASWPSTNEAVERAEVAMLGSIFGAIALLCFLTFRSWKAVLCIIVPLASSRFSATR